MTFPPRRPRVNCAAPDCHGALTDPPHAWPWSRPTSPSRPLAGHAVVLVELDGLVRGEALDERDDVRDAVQDSGGGPIRELRISSTCVEPLSTRIERMPASRPDFTSVSMRSPIMTAVSSARRSGSAPCAS